MWTLQWRIVYYGYFCKVVLHPSLKLCKNEECDVQLQNHMSGLIIHWNLREERHQNSKVKQKDDLENILLGDGPCEKLKQRGKRLLSDEAFDPSCLLTVRAAVALVCLESQGSHIQTFTSPFHMIGPLWLPDFYPRSIGCQPCLRSLWWSIHPSIISQLTLAEGRVQPGQITSLSQGGDQIITWYSTTGQMWGLLPDSMSLQQVALLCFTEKF